MLSRAVVSLGSSCDALTNDANAAASSPLASATSPAVRCATALIFVVRNGLFDQQLGRVALPFGQLRQCELGQRRGIARFAAQRVPSLHDGGFDLSRVSQRHHVERACLFGIGMLLDEDLKPRGRLLLLAAPSTHLPERHRDLFGIG